MENNNIKSSIDFKDKGPTYWKWFLLKQVRLAAHYLQAMDGIERLEDLERQESDHDNLVQSIAKPEIRRFYCLRFLEKTWHYDDVRATAIKMVNRLAEDIDGMPVTHEAFLRMATVRISEDTTQLGHLESDFFSAALAYGFGLGLQLYIWPSTSEGFVISLAKFLQLTSRDEWQRSAEFSLMMSKWRDRNAEQAAG